MAVPGIGSLIQTTMVCSSAYQFSQNVRHWVVSAIAGAGASDQQLIDAMSTDLAALIKPMMASTAEYTGLKGQVLKPVPLTAVVSLNGAGAGASATDLMAPQTAALFRLGTGLAGKSYRGRCYIPFPAEGFNAATGIPTGAYLVTLASIASFHASPYTVTAGAGNTLTIKPVIYSRKLNSQTDVTGYTVSQAWATIRRRSNQKPGDQPPI